MSECTSQRLFRHTVEEEWISYWPGAFIITQAAERTSLVSYFNSLPVTAPRFPKFQSGGGNSWVAKSFSTAVDAFGSFSFGQATESERRGGVGSLHHLVI